MKETETSIPLEDVSRNDVTQTDSKNDEATRVDAVSDQASNEAAKKTHYSSLFWAIFAGLVLTAMVSALDGSVVSTAMPTIVRDLQAGKNYVWVANVYFLTR